MKNIVITGCSRGIGHGIAQIFLQSDEYYVIGTSTSGKSPIEHQNFICYPLSLDNEKSVDNFISNLTKKHISLDGLINNAAVLLEEWSDASIDHELLNKTFQVNLFGTTNLTEKLLPKINNQAKIINIASNWGSFSDPAFNEFQPHYKMSKAALNMYSRLLAQRLKEQQINVSSFDPGWVKTDMGGMSALKDPLEVGKEILHLFQTDIPSGYFWKDGKTREW